jgi:hypothetical protein
MKKSSTAVIAKKASPKKTNSAATPVTRVCVSDGKTERSVSVRKIENGYIVSESTYGGKKGYSSTERFVEKAPTLDVQGVKAKK